MMIIPVGAIQETNSSSPVLINLAFNTKNVIGLSGLYYINDKDLLLFTASEEDTPNATQDGVIGNSYLGYIKKFSEKMTASTLHPDKMITLTDIDPVFKKQKVESVCVEKIVGNSAIVHLASDNDNGQSMLFKTRLILE